jgi:mannose-6-phosphate isomerase-like protein (cupin superfamily)
VAAVVAVAGTHIGHVVGHSLGKELKATVMADTFDTQSLEDAPVVTAPDGSMVRPLCRITGVGSFAHFQLEPGEAAKAVSHTTVQEIWYVLAGAGQLWRRQGDRERTVALRPGVCLTIPLGAAFQFRSMAGNEPLQVVAVTIPPWPIGSEDEARFEDGPWRAIVPR